MEEIRVPKIHLGFDQDSTAFLTFGDDLNGVDIDDLTSSNFGSVLLKWRELNLSEAFVALTR